MISEQKWTDNAASHQWIFLENKTFLTTKQIEIIENNQDNILIYFMKEFKCVSCGLIWSASLIEGLPKVCDYSCSEYLLVNVME